MPDLLYIPLLHRSIIAISGAESEGFLQGLITNDMELVSNGQAIYAALLTPQGKYLHDFFIMGTDDGYLLECEDQRRPDLMTRLKRYRLRAQVDLRETGNEFEVYALMGSGVNSLLGVSGENSAVAGYAGGHAFTDPREAVLGARAYLPAGTGAQILQEAGFQQGDLASYDALRFSHAIADGAPEIEPEKSYPMDYGLDRLNGVSFSKGCYVGQEVTVRMKNRDLARKCLAPVKIDGPPPAIGTRLNLGDANAGELRGVSGDSGLALVRKDLLDRAMAEGTPLTTEGAQFHPAKIA
jgi:folate-binding protein YgfZ